MVLNLDSATNKTVTCLSSFNDSVYSAVEHEILCWDLGKRSIRRYGSHFCFGCKCNFLAFFSKWKAGNDSVTAILALSDNNRLVTASRNIRIWNVSTKQILKTFTGHSYEVTILEAINPKQDGDTYIISGSKVRNIFSSVVLYHMGDVSVGGGWKVLWYYTGAFPKL